MSKDTFLDYSTTASDNTDIGGISITGGAPPSNFDNAIRTLMAQMRADLDGKVVNAAKSGAYTAVANDNNAVLRFTAAATLSLTAAATLGANWHITVVADGGAVTIDPNSSETINGLATMIVPDGSSAEIICSGSAFFTVFRPSGWQIIERRTFSSVATVDFTNLYGDVRVTGFIDQGATASDVIWRSSTDNGTNFDAGASDYASQLLSGSGASAAAARVIDTYALLAGGGFAAGLINLHLVNFGRAFPCFGNSHISGAPTGGVSSIAVQTIAQVRSSSTARNALRIGTTSGNTFSGHFTVECLK